MATGMRGTRDFYKERFGLGDRVAVRLAALLAHKVDLSAAAIECLKDSPPLQHVVLHPQFLDVAKELTTERLRSLTLPGEELPAAFVVAESKGWRTIALAEELLAEEGEGPEAEEAQLPALASKGELLHPSEIHDLFTRRDIAELELILRTSADAKEKVTALRRLALAPAGDGEKMALFAMALIDRDAEVRGEAAQALTVLGLPADVADDARALAEGNERQKQFAAQRIGRRFKDATDAELGVLLRIVAGTLRYEPAVAVRRLLIRAVEGACRAVARDARSTRDLVGVLLAQLRDAADELGPEVRRVLLLLGEGNPAEVHRALQQELATIADHRVRRPLVGAVLDLAAGAPAPVGGASAPRGPGQRGARRPRPQALATKEVDEAVRQGLDEIEASPDPSVECLAIVNALSRLGEAGVPAVAGRLLGAPEAAQETMVRLLDLVGVRPETPAATKAEVGRVFLATLRRGQRAARLAVVNSLATTDPAVAPATRRALATELIGSLHEYANPGILAAIESTVAKLGAPAVAPLIEMIVRGERPAPRVAAARVLGDLVSRLDARHARDAEKAADAVLAVLDGKFPDRPTLARALGQMCAGPAADAATVERVVAGLRARILDGKLSHAALDGLGRVCLSPNAAPTLKVDLLDFFSRLLERDLPEIEATSVERKDEIVYTLGGEVTAYTELVPGIVTGLRNIAVTTRGVRREQALDRLTRAWRQIAEGKLQLGPGNTELLLAALHAIGILPDAAPAEREAIADALALRRDYLPTYRALADVAVAAGRAMAPRGVAIAEELLERDATDKQLTASERYVVLEALVRLATAAELGRPAARLRERIVGAVAEACQREVERVPELARRLRESPAIAQRLKKRLPEAGL